jgi:dTDP-4-dehydrorhamnose 3,5-epimerase
MTVQIQATELPEVLSEANHAQLYIPPGFAHGFEVLSDGADVIYQCTAYYCAPADRGVRWNDPALVIPCRTENPALSEKDRALPLLADIPESDLPEFRGE